MIYLDSPCVSEKTISLLHPIIRVEQKSYHYHVDEFDEYDRLPLVGVTSCLDDDFCLEGDSVRTDELIDYPGGYRNRVNSDKDDVWEEDNEVIA